MPKIGYACHDKNGPVVHTVAPTEIEAKANGLVVFFGVIIGRDWPQAHINEEWARHLGDKNFPVRRVHIVPTEAMN